MWSRLGADHEARHADVADRDRLAFDREAALGEVVVQEQPAQIFAVHARRHPRAVGVPGHQIVRLLALAHQVGPDHARPDQVVGAQHLERAGHLRGCRDSPARA